MSSLTIVIPTRERCDTLSATLKSCVQQRLPELTILVVDNFSDDATGSVVASFQDSRIQYVNTGKRLAMSANWEFALQHVRSDYVTFLGDDDALLPNAAIDLMSLVDEHIGLDAISWPSVEYGWPSCQVPQVRDLIVVPLRRGLERRSTREMLLDVINFRRAYSELPFLYKGLVRTEVINRLRAASNGQVFHSRIPDVYFGIAACAQIDEYLFSYRPYTVNGASGHSNGTSTFAGLDGKEAERKFLSEDNLPFHPALKLCPSLPVLVIESLLQARKVLPKLAPFEPDMDKMVRAAIAHARRAPANVFAAVIAALQPAAARTPLSLETNTAIIDAVNEPYLEVESIYGVDIFNKRLLLDARQYAVNDCFSAASVADSLIRLHRSNILSAKSVLQNSFALLSREIAKRSQIYFRASMAFRSRKVEIH